MTPAPSLELFIDKQASHFIISKSLAPGKEAQRKKDESPA
jgi:hypothetical protein